jgi:hypothetical protein
MLRLKAQKKCSNQDMEKIEITRVSNDDALLYTAAPARLVARRCPVSIFFPHLTTFLSSSDRKSSLSKCRSMASCKKCPNVQLNPYPPPRLLELKELGKKLSIGKRELA